MTDTTLLATIKKTMADEWKILLPFIRDGKAYAHLRDRHAAAVMALETLAKRAETTEARQPALVQE